MRKTNKKSAAVLSAMLVLSGAAQALNGTWTNSVSGTNWNWGTAGNWAGGTIATGSTYTADFSTVNITNDMAVQLSAAWTVGNLIFGDTDTNTAAGWTLGYGSSSTRTLTLAGGTPAITVNALGAGTNVIINVKVLGSEGLVKDGPGTLTFTTNSGYTGTTLIKAGTLEYAHVKIAAPATTNIIVANGATLLSGGTNANLGLPSGCLLTVQNGGTLQLDKGITTKYGKLDTGASVTGAGNLYFFSPDTETMKTLITGSLNITNTGGLYFRPDGLTDPVQTLVFDGTDNGSGAVIAKFTMSPMSTAPNKTTGTDTYIMDIGDSPAAVYDLTIGVLAMTKATNTECLANVLIKQGAGTMMVTENVTGTNNWLAVNEGTLIFGGTASVFTNITVAGSGTLKFSTAVPQPLNLSDSGVVFAGGLSTAKNFNFNGPGCTVYLAGFNQRTNLAKAVSAGKVQINGTNAADSSYFSCTDVTLNGADWTRITVFNPGAVTLTPVDSSTLNGKLMCGYQAWFTAAGDYGTDTRWIHWALNGGTPASTNLTVEMYPDISEYDADELFATTMTKGGQPAMLYSGTLYKTVRRHVRWMQEYGIDGAFVQRFVVTQAGSDTSYKNHMLNALKNFKAGCEEYGRVFAVMYDVSGMASTSTWWSVMTNDWQMLVDSEIVTSDRYLKHNGKPVVGIWGFGFKTDPHGPTDPAVALDAINWFKTGAPAQYRASVFGGVPGEWRTLSGDSFTASGWTGVYHAFDVVSPWTVGRYNSDSGADSWKTQRIIPDLANTSSAGITYCPVIWPGFSWYNLFMSRDGVVKTKNEIPRRAGDFFWRQAYNALSANATNMLYIAMFDEVDEATAIYKTAPTAADAPDQGYWLTLNADGTTLPSDWYLRLAYETGRMLRKQTAVTSTRPSNPGPFSTSHGTTRSWLSSYNLAGDGYEVADQQDQDGDGFTTWQEYLAGTDPTNAASLLHLTGIKLSGSGLSVSWYGTGNGSTSKWSMYVSTNLVTGGWTLTASNSITRNPQNGTNVWVDTSATNVPVRFYRPAVLY